VTSGNGPSKRFLYKSYPLQGIPTESSPASRGRVPPVAAKRIGGHWNLCRGHCSSCATDALSFSESVGIDFRFQGISLESCQKWIARALLRGEVSPPNAQMSQYPQPPPAIRSELYRGDRKSRFPLQTTSESLVSIYSPLTKSVGIS
jgi:hypothetical protein